MNTFFYCCTSHNPFETLAVEEALLESVAQHTPVLLLYTHTRCVVVGRNQNAWAECRTRELQDDGGVVARRVSGGGAVYHDIGNLNFSFIMPRALYDTARQSDVLLRTMHSLGIEACRTGRNDLYADGRKFSGNAFCVRSDAAFHHGTLLISTDLDRMVHYLGTSTGKIHAKGVASVRSRVVNLTELMPALTPDTMRDALVQCFSDEYGAASELELPPAAADRALELAARNSQWNWIFGKTPPFDTIFSGQFVWGSAEVRLHLKDGIIREALVFSDSLEPDFIARLGPALVGLPLSASVLREQITIAAHSADEMQQASSLCALVESEI